MNRVIQSFWSGKLTPMELLCMQSFIQNGHEFHLYTYGDVTGIPSNVVVKDANEILPRATLLKFRAIQQASDLFRVAMLLKNGGWYVDMDVVCLRPFDFAGEYVFGQVADGGGVTVQNNIMRAPKGSPLMQHWYTSIMQIPEADLSGLAFQGIGPDFVSRAVEKFNLQRFVKPWQTFDPVGWKRMDDIVNPNATWDLGSSHAVHLFHAAWNNSQEKNIHHMSATTEGVYSAGCLYEQLKRRVFSTPKVSVVMTTFNRAAQLTRTLESIAVQSYKDFEVIIVDDGSDAETPQVCSRCWPFSMKYFRLNRARVGARSGPAVALNFGVRRASGEIVVMQNAECRHVGETLKQLLAALTPDNAVLCQADHFSEAGVNLGIKVDIKEARYAYFFCGAIYKSWVYALRGFDEDFNGVWGGEDDDFSFRLQCAGVKFCFLDTRVQHQWHPGCLAVDWQARTSQAADVADSLHTKKRLDLTAGRIGVTRNLGREWGCVSDGAVPVPQSIAPRNQAPVGKPKYGRDGCTIDWFDTHPNG